MDIKKIIFLFLSFILVGCHSCRPKSVYTVKPFLSSSPVIMAKSTSLNGKILYCFDQACKIQNKKELYNNDFWQSPEETKILKTGDCEDKAIYLHNLLKKNQIPSQLCIGFHNLVISGRTMHAWIEVEMIHGTYILDPAFSVIIKRSILPETSYAPVFGDYYIYKKIKNFKHRANYKDILNDKYESFFWFIFKNKWAFKAEELRS